MVRWTPGSVDLITAINSNTVVEKNAMTFVCFFLRFSKGQANEGNSSVGSTQPGTSSETAAYDSRDDGCSQSSSLPPSSQPGIWVSRQWQKKKRKYEYFIEKFSRSVDLIPAKNSNTNFVGHYVLFAHCGLNWHWAPGSLDLFPYENSNAWFLRTLRYNCSLWILWHIGLQDPMVGFRPYENSNTDFIGSTFVFLLTVD